MEMTCLGVYLIAPHSYTPFSGPHPSVRSSSRGDPLLPIWDSALLPPRSPHMAGPPGPLVIMPGIPPMMHVDRITFGLEERLEWKLTNGQIS